ncbi:nitrate reductase cytochrome c-type subunit [Thalassotalea agarivorans]|uniref:Periplasmic nitrate reductase, electron transfer subunit n=1 Tax=Thalassotalea agarivorans TaxID=349064 RepID=A0A1H9ZCI6_THASX|nr:nitrate reductase cytochrome c-type subunit [Thalassotalea agarivorans]SES79196.1 periplasmic nitrate reductase subunit NapB [Thalassotalea agarivorans]
MNKLIKAITKPIGLLVVAVTVSIAGLAYADNDSIATLRDATPIDSQKKPSAIPKVSNDDIRKSRNYPMQPPLIPHDIRGYEVNLNTNKCMTCHSRQKTEQTQAPMVSVTHYMDRDGNFLAEVSPRRYFCSQCHVVQTEVKPLVENEFVDMHTLSKQKQESSKK